MYLITVYSMTLSVTQTIQCQTVLLGQDYHIGDP